MIGLWIYRTEANLYDNKFQKNYNETKSDDSRLTYLNEIQFYSDELIVEDVLKSIVNRIEVNNEAQLKTNVDNMDTNVAEPASSNPSASRKRKFSNGDEQQINNNNNENGDNSTNKRKCQANDGGDHRLNKTKLFDPVNEHFNWCPWQEHAHSTSSSSSSFMIKSEERNVSSIHFDIIKRYLIKLKDDSQLKPSNNESQAITKQQQQQQQYSISTLSPFKTNAENNTVKNESELTSLTSEMLLQRIKSVQSLLINCTSNYSSSNKQS